MSRPGRPRTGAPTLREIAERTGYGLMTVSRALGPDPEAVTADKRLRIQAVAAELNYRPNLNIRALRRGSGTLVGLLCERFDARVHDLLIGLHDVLVPQGLLPCLMVIGHHQARPGMDPGTATIHHLVERRMAAVLAVLPRPDALPDWLPALRQEAHERGLPTLLAGAAPQQADLPLVRSDLPAAASLLVEHAAAQGARLAVVDENPGDPWTTALAGLITATATERGVPWFRLLPDQDLPDHAVPVATSTAALLALAGQRTPPAGWISSGDASTCPLAGLAVDLADRDLGTLAGQLLIEALAGRPLPACTDLPPRHRRAT